VAAQARFGSQPPSSARSGCNGSGEVGQLQRGRIVLDYRCELLQTHAGEDVHDGGEALQWDAVAGRWANRMTGTRPWLFHANGGLLMKVRQGRPGRGEGAPQRDVAVHSSLTRSAPYHGNEASFLPNPITFLLLPRGSQERCALYHALLALQVPRPLAQCVAFGVWWPRLQAKAARVMERLPWSSSHCQPTSASLGRCCALCQRQEAAGEVFARCSRCRTHYYCSTACQRQAWPTHGPHCIPQS
jgi:hypothetical protein